MNSHLRTPPRPLAANAVTACLACLAAMAALTEHGFHEPPLPDWALRAIALLSFVAIAAVDRLNPSRSGRFRPGPFLFAAGGLAGVLGATQLVPQGWILFEIALGLLLVGAWSRLNLSLARSATACVLLIPLNLVLLIIAGTLVLKTPEALRIVTEHPLALRDPIGGKLQWLDAVFTMTSAVCLTGLTVRDVSQFSALGQTVIALFVQVGGLTAAVAGSVLIVLRFPKTLGGELRANGDFFDADHRRQVTSLVVFVVAVTLACELAGALAMMPLWPASTVWGDRLATSLFHSISAFCNSGFAMPVDSLQSHRHALVTHLVVGPLVVVGGLGFPVIRDVWRTVQSRASRRVEAARLSANSRIVLVMTCTLYLFGTAAFAMAQWARADGVSSISAPQSWQRVGAAIADGSFMSLSARSAGFTTVPIDGLEPTAEVVLMTQMIVGASPGGTGGGMKTTVVALLLMAAATSLGRRRRSRVSSVSIPARLLTGACAVALFFVAIVAAATALLCASESIPVKKALFESVSAAGASGLTCGVTTQLTRFGKAVIIATMFLGRVVPLMIAFVTVLGGRAGNMGCDREVLIG